jgi:hypothetical protein
MAAATWALDHDVREDADSVFVPATELPAAVVGDAVTFRGDHGAREGRVTALVDDGERGTFVAVALEPPPPRPAVAGDP